MSKDPFLYPTREQRLHTLIFIQWRAWELHPQLVLLESNFRRHHLEGCKRSLHSSDSFEKPLAVHAAHYTLCNSLIPSLWQRSLPRPQSSLARFSSYETHVIDLSISSYLCLSVASPSLDHSKYFLKRMSLWTHAGWKRFTVFDKLFVGSIFLVTMYTTTTTTTPTISAALIRFLI